MYFYVYNGQLYWGKYQAIAPRRNVWTWMFRRKPMKPHRLYISGTDEFAWVPEKLNVIFRSSFEVVIKSSSIFGDEHFHPIRILEGYCYRLSERGLACIAATDRNSRVRKEFKNMFKNRLKEYQGRYFLPIDKHANYA